MKNKSTSKSRPRSQETAHDADDGLKTAGVDVLQHQANPEYKSAMELDNSSTVEVSKSDALDHLSYQEKEVLKRQLLMPDVSTSYIMLYRYATKIDILILVVSVMCSMASGVVMPLMTVNSNLLSMIKETN